MKTILTIVSATRQSCSNRLDGIHQYAREHGYRVQVVERLFKAINVSELLETWYPDGVIAECGAGGEELMPQAFGKIPVVYIDADEKVFGRSFYVNLDTVRVGEMAAEYLLSLDFCDFAYVPFRTPVFWCAERFQAFKAELVRNGYGCHVFESPHGMDIARWQADLRAWLVRLPKPCALLAANDGMAEFVVNACLSLGLTMPNEVAVLGVDNEVPTCENCVPSISSIAVDFFGAGYQAAELLDQRLGNRDCAPGIRRYRAVRVVVRQSTRLGTRGRGRVDEGLEYIRRHAQEGIAVEDVVREMGVPRRTAELNFRKVLGKSILDAVNDIRFARVFDLLARPQQSLKAIHDFCGFSTASALRKAFRRRTGLSMSEWRDLHRQ